MVSSASPLYRNSSKIASEFQKRVRNVSHIVVVNAIGREHIQSFRDLAHLRDEEAHMVRTLRPDGLAVLNGDDDNVRWMATQTRARVVTYGLHPGNDVYASDLVLAWPYGTRFLLHAHRQRQVVQSRLIGTFMLYPLLAAAAVALTVGRSLFGGGGSARTPAPHARTSSAAAAPRRSHGAAGRL